MSEPTACAEPDELELTALLRERLPTKEEREAFAAFPHQIAESVREACFNISEAARSSK